MVIKLAISLRLSSDSNCADIKHSEESNVEYSVPLLEELFKAGSLGLPSLVVLLVAYNFELESLYAFRSPPLHDAVCRRSEKLYSLLDHGIGQPEERGGRIFEGQVPFS
jgi:hypothetical protein